MVRFHVRVTVVLDALSSVASGKAPEEIERRIVVMSRAANCVG